MKRLVIFMSLFVIFLSGCISPSSSQVLLRNEKQLVEVVGNTVYIVGWLSRDVLASLKDLEPGKQYIISLSSSGGEVSASMVMSLFIRMNQYTTYVGRNKRCYSACTLLFQAGIRRIAHKSASFLYHAVRYSKFSRKNPGKICEDCTTRFTKNLVFHGMNRKLLDIWPDYDSTLILTAGEAMDYNIVNELIVRD